MSYFSLCFSAYSLNCSFNSLPTPGQISSLVSVLKAKTLLGIASFINQSAQGEFPLLIEALQTTSSLTELHFARVLFETESETDKLVQIIKNNPRLSSLRLEGTAISRRTMIKIAAAIQARPSFCELQNSLIEQDGHSFFVIKKGGAHVQDIALYEAIGTVIPSLQASSSNCHLAQLTLTYMQAGDEIGTSIAAALAHNVSLDVLEIANSHLTDLSGKALAQALETNTVLSRLKLANNQLTDETGRCFAKTITVNFSLKDLGLQGNRFTKAMTGIFAEAVTNSTIHHIDCLYSETKYLLDEYTIQKLRNNRYNYDLVAHSLTKRLLDVCDCRYRGPEKRK